MHLYEYTLHRMYCAILMTYCIRVYNGKGTTVSRYATSTLSFLFVIDGSITSEINDFFTESEGENNLLVQHLSLDQYHNLFPRDHHLNKLFQN